MYFKITFVFSEFLKLSESDSSHCNKYKQTKVYLVTYLLSNFSKKLDLEENKILNNSSRKFLREMSQELFRNYIVGFSKFNLLQ